MSCDKQYVELLESAKTALEAFLDYVRSHNRSESEERDHDLLTEAQIAERLHVSLSAVRKGRAKGRYPFFFKEGGRWLTTEASYAKWLETREKRAGAK